MTKKKDMTCAEAGRLRWEGTTPEERSEAASKAAKALASKRKKNPKKLASDMSEAGKIGGAARAAALTPSQRSEIAKAAAKSRWAKGKTDGKSQQD